MNLALLQAAATAATMNVDKIGIGLVIVGIGLYLERKGILDFVELAKRLPEYKFIWFGSSPIAAATSDVKKALKELWGRNTPLLF